MTVLDDAPTITEAPEGLPDAPVDAPVPATLRPSVLQTKLIYAEKLADASLLTPEYRKRPANVLWAVEYGAMLGLSPIAAMLGIHVIDGKPTASAALMSALVRKAKHRLRVSLKYDPKTGHPIGRAELTRADDPDFTFVAEWTIERAMRAGLCTVDNGGVVRARNSKNNPQAWEKFTEAMVKARAISEVCRDGCEEVLFGLHYTPEELGADVDDEGIPVIDVDGNVVMVDTMEQAAKVPTRETWADARPRPAAPPPPTIPPGNRPTPKELEGASEADRLGWLREEVDWICRDILGKAYRNALVKRGRKNVDQMSLEELGILVGESRAMMVAPRMAAMGMEDVARFYAGWAVGVAAPVPVLTGHVQTAPSEPQQPAEDIVEATVIEDLNQGGEEVSGETSATGEAPVGLGDYEDAWDNLPHPFDARDDNPNACSECPHPEDHALHVEDTGEGYF